MSHEVTPFARVVIPSPLKLPLIYQIPAHLAEPPKVGTRVLIPLGKRKVTGIVVELLSDTTLAHTKPILALLDDQPIIDPKLIELSQWVAQYYLSTLGEVYATILPPTLRGASRRTVVAKNEAYSTEDPVARKILQTLRQRKGKASIETLTRAFPGGKFHQALNQLLTDRAVEIRERLAGQQRRGKDIFTTTEAHAQPATVGPVLTEEQSKAFAEIQSRLNRGGFETFLLHGVTGSGKSEIYFRAMEQAQKLGRRCLIMIPEISLTAQLLDRLTLRFPGRIGILHSALTDAERRAHWWRILRGHVDVVVGARSAVFAPLPDIGVIIVDEEHDPSYKQEEGVRYNARDVAVVRGKLLGCPVILGSATPSVESYENSLRGRYRLLEMSQRVEGRPLPKIETIDLRLEFSRALAPNDGAPASPQANISERLKSIEQPLISPRLGDLLATNYREFRQSLIFLNRRGFANFLQCRLCGYVLRCSYCSVSLTWHLKQKNVCCHHCNFRRPVTEICSGCGNATLSGVGVGTEQIEQSLHRLLPGARIARMDRDTTSKRGSHVDLIRRWEKGEIDVLVGTQMITKGHDVSGVTLVGALLADLSLNLPDFRAAERTYQLLSQVAGRSGRGNDPGHVIIQTYTPDHYAVEHLARHDYKGFFSAEIEYRRALNYPPFSRLVSLLLDGPRGEEVESRAQNLAAFLREKRAKNSKFRDQVEVLGPAPAPLQKLRNRYRWHLLLKGKKISSLLELASQAREAFPPARVVRLHVDVDPYSML